MAWESIAAEVTSGASSRRRLRLTGCCTVEGGGGGGRRGVWRRERSHGRPQDASVPGWSSDNKHPGSGSADLSTPEPETRTAVTTDPDSDPSETGHKSDPNRPPNRTTVTKINAKQVHTDHSYKKTVSSQVNFTMVQVLRTGGRNPCSLGTRPIPK